MTKLTVHVSESVVARAARVAPALKRSTVMRRLLELGVEAAEREPGRILGDQASSTEGEERREGAA